MAKKTEAVGQVQGQTNPRKLEYPTDQYGVTTDFRAAVARLGLAVRGDAGKLEVVERSFEVAIGYIRARYAEDCQLREAMLAETEIISGEGTNDGEADQRNQEQQPREPGLQPKG